MEQSLAAQKAPPLPSENGSAEPQPPRHVRSGRHADAADAAADAGASAPQVNPGARYVGAVFTSAGVTTMAWVAGVVFAAGLLSALCLLGAAAIVGSENYGARLLDLGGVLAAIFVLVGGSLGGGLQLSGSLYEEAAVPGDGGSITIVALGALALAVVGVARVARVRMPSEPAPSSWTELARAAIESAGVAALIAIIVAFARISTGAGAEAIVIRSDPGAVFLILLSVLTATLFLTREPRRRRMVGQHAGAWARACREAGVYLAVQGATFGILALLGAVILAKDLGSSGGFFALLPLLGNLAVAGATLGHFGSLVFVSSTGVGELATAGDLLGGMSVAIVGVTLLSLGYATAAVGLRRQRGGPIQWPRVWRMPLLVCGFWCVLALGLAGVTLRGEVETLVGVSGIASVALPWSAPLLVGLGALIASIAAESVPDLMYRVNPALLRGSAGRNVVEAWLSEAVPGQLAQASAEGTGLQTVAPSGPRSGTPQRTQQGNLIAGSILVLLIAFGGGTALTVKLLNQDRAPSALTRSYLEALASGDARRATEMVDPGVRNSERELLTNATLESAEQLIEVVGLETVERTSSTALVRATYSLDGEHFEHDFRLTREPQEMLFLESWKLAEPLLFRAKVGVEGLQSVNVGDTEISVPQGGDDDTSAVTPNEEDGSRSVYLYPGLYRLSAADNPYVTTSTEELRAIPSDTLAETTFWVRMKPKPTFELEVLQQVRLRIDQCAAKPTNLDRVCPEYLRQKDLAEAEVLSQVDRFEEIGIGAFTTAEAVVKVRPGPNPLNADPAPEEHRFTVEGRIEFVDGEPKIRDLVMRERTMG